MRPALWSIPQASKPTARRAFVRRPLPAPTSKQKGLVGVREMPSLQNSHFLDPTPEDVVEDEGAVHNVEDAVGRELEDVLHVEVLPPTSAVPDGIRPAS